MRRAGILVLIFLGISAGDALAGTVTIAPGQTCTSAGCHESFGKQKHVHAAMEGGECSACHEQQGDQHVFQFTAEGNELCLQCHDVVGKKKNQHPAVEIGCTSCHDPHQSENRFLLQAEPLSSLCFTCHDESLVKKKWGHGPAEAGECTMCHNPHESDNQSLLVAAVPNLCFTCHAEEEEALKSDSVVHGAVEEGCTECHDPHSEDQRFFLHKAIPQLCFGCHDDIQEKVENAVVKHGIIEKDKRCLNCHLPHSSNNENLLKTKANEICFTCHNVEMQTDTGRLRNMKAWMETKKNVHPPAEDGGCTNCHEVHGSPYYRLLNAEYPSGFYSPFSEKAYALCFSCHDSRIFQYEKTTKLTGFRDGATNLHFLHVNKPVKGRVCTVCHDPHATDSPRLIKEKTLFGTWEMPIRFQKTETGGSCYPGCHKRQAYDREKPVLKKEESSD